MAGARYGLKCSIDNCDRVIEARGLCRKHYQQQWRTGDPLFRSVLRSDSMTRFLAKVEKTKTCWIWKAGVTSEGYGKFSNGGKTLLAHRFIIDAQPHEVVDHICRVRICVNPDHLRQVTHRLNILAGIGPAAINARKTHCCRGHELPTENRKNGCKTCRAHRYDAAYWREYRARRTAEGRSVK